MFFFWSDFNDNCNFSTEYDKSSHHTKSILWGPSDADEQMSRWADEQTDWQTNRHGYANSNCSQLCEQNW